MIGLRDLGRERARVADARRAAVTDDVEAELRERLHETRLVVVVGDDERARRERRLHPGRNRQAARDRVPGEETRRDHHRRVRRVRARRDRGDHDCTVGEIERSTVGQHDRRASASWSVAPSPADAGQRLREPAFAARERDAILRPGRTRERRLDRREVELDGLVVLRHGVGVVPETLLLRVVSTSAMRSSGRPVAAQVAQRLVVDREQRARRSVLRRHVADRRPVLERHAATPSP